MALHTRKLVTALVETAVVKGSLFIETSGRRWLRERGIFVPSVDVHKAAATFLNSWSTGQMRSARESIQKYGATAFTNALIEYHQLVIVQRRLLNESIDEVSIRGLQQQTYKQDLYHVQDIDGILNHQDVVNMIRSKEIGPRTRVKQVGDRFNWKFLSNFPEFQRALEDAANTDTETPIDKDTGLATRTPDLDPSAGSAFHLFSNLRNPAVSVGQKDYIKALFDLDHNDKIIWHESLTDDGIGIQANEIFKTTQTAANLIARARG